MRCHMHAFKSLMPLLLSSLLSQYIDRNLYTRYQIIIIKYQFFETILISLIIDRMHTYAIRNISFNRKIYPHIYSSTMCRSIFDVH